MHATCQEVVSLVKSVLMQDKSLWQAVKINMQSAAAKLVRQVCSEADKLARCREIARSVQAALLQCGSSPESASQPQHVALLGCMCKAGGP